MRKRICVIGGSYFIGRVFTILAARSGEFEIHVVNRGSRPFKPDAVTQHVCDRHDKSALASVVPALEWDAVIDFCAYEPGEVATVCEALPGAVKHYILISSCGVYALEAPLPGAGAALPARGDAVPLPKDESAPLISASLIARGGDDPGLAYSYKKTLLEEEAKVAATARGCPVTVLRPAFVYGPLNYAPREHYYFSLIAGGEPIPDPIDATGRFSFAYVKDIGRVLLACAGNARVYGGVYNIAGPEVLDYASYLRVLEAAHGKPLATTPVAVADVHAMRIPLPFPLEEDAAYSGAALAKALDFVYTPFSEGMKETYDIFMQKGSS